MSQPIPLPRLNAGETQIPSDRSYARGHFWLQPGPGGFRVGLTSVGVRGLPEDFLLEWSVAAGEFVRDRQSIARLETSQGDIVVSSPVAGRIMNFNEPLLDDPTLLRTDPYGLGWLLHLETDARFLTAVEYAELVSRES